MSKRWHQADSSDPADKPDMPIGIGTEFLEINRTQLDFTI